jgi:hypothetical protein
LRGLAYENGQPDRSWKRRERLPLDVFGHEGFENLLPRLMRPHFAGLSILYNAGFLRHTDLLVQKM